MQQLENYREQIDAVDQQIVALLAERRKIVSAIVAHKKAHHLPVYHPAREEDLIHQRRAQGQSAGLEADFVEELFRLILRHSRAVQSTRMALTGVRLDAAVLIVGGRGAMGCYFQRWFQRSGYQVRILDKDDWQDVKALCCGIALALISVPIEHTEDVIRRLCPHLPQTCVLADITSIKAAILKTMLACHNGPVMGLHPLFGPTTSSMDKQIIVATPGRDGAAAQWLLDQLAAWGGIVVTAQATEHDQNMAVVQALRHFAAFTFGQFLYRQQIDLGRTLEFSSPIYRLELGMVGRLFAQDARLYAEIIFATPHCRRIIKAFIASVGDNLELLETADKERFCREFEKIASFFGCFSEQALRESTYVIDKLIERF